ncbi:23S rRNA (guanosine(2251)-2'-O)-methyltransferase RlmB [Actinoallomurus bryophytorum]|uniref:23S rRNA (Guanosine2251-2'-O)-methyltransferase n=1 Tax=Actinoallomurus bryophytorum TaxID=1490222 RepID=A0A543CH64_9ACTN|nr:23S rRNA (guanosine(2251)-2'-O)-methyltransferase RlmB [Actinoallomurus bryophytorum]TQL96257.1 23S rRNA (guanosine2251-2'-O)-methyltransferase [Actinoallomurus bryophytorum]
MAKRRKKGSSHTPKAEDRHWYGKRQTARATKAATRTGSVTTGPRRDSSAAGDRPQRRPAPEGPEIVTGRNPVVEALRAGIPASTLYVMTGASDDRIRESIKLATDAGVALLEAGKIELDRMTDRAVHQGIALQVPEYDYAHPDDLLQLSTKPLIVALDGVTDPRNLGAVVRSAAAFGAHGVLVPERRAAGVTAGAWKASAGTLASVPVARATNLVRALKAYQSAGLFVAGLDARGATGVDALDAADGPLVLVVGSEGKGLSRLVADTCDLLINIPMPGKAESLNAGVAGSIALYEIARHR